MQAGKAAAHPEVEMIEGAGTNADEDFLAAKLRLGNVGEAENGRVAVMKEDDGFHERPPRSEMRWSLTTGRYNVSRQVRGASGTGSARFRFHYRVEDESCEEEKKEEIAVIQAPADAGSGVVGD